jgi:hypothetical protein
MDHARRIQEQSFQLWLEILQWMSRPETYYQIFLILTVLTIVFGIAKFIRFKLHCHKNPEVSAQRYSKHWFIGRSGRLLYPLFAIILFALAEYLSTALLGDAIVVRAAQRVAIVWLFWVGLWAFVTNRLIRTVGFWILVPSALLQLFGLFEPVVNHLDGYGMSLGGVRITVYTLIKAVLVVSILVWIGRELSRTY